jgi:hypothetical protein
MIVFALCVAVVVMREVVFYLHDTRRDKLISELTDKIKAKDFVEYTQQTQPPPMFESVDRDDEELWEMEIEERKV